MLDMTLAVAGLIILTGSPVILFLCVLLCRSWITRKRFADILTGDLHALASYAGKNARKFLVLTIGIFLLIIGIAMMVLPGPATIVIPLALALLGTEFVWARRVLKYFLDSAKYAAQQLTGSSHDGIDDA